MPRQLSKIYGKAARAYISNFPVHKNPEIMELRIMKSKYERFEKRIRTVSNVCVGRSSKAMVV